MTTIHEFHRAAGRTAADLGYYRDLTDDVRQDPERLAAYLHGALDRIIVEVQEARAEIPSYAADGAPVSNHPFLLELADVCLVAMSLTYNLGHSTALPLVLKSALNAERAAITRLQADKGVSA